MTMPKPKGILQQFQNLPNALTLLRILVIPAVLSLITRADPVSSFYAALLFVGAAITDALDGYLARRTGAVTMMGKFLDPLADKLLVMGCLVFLVAKQRVAPWLAVVLIGRELAITGLRAIASAQGLVIAASAGGKNKTAFQLVGLTALILHYPYPLWGTSWVVDLHIVGTYLIYISLLFSVFSALEYVQLFVEGSEGT